MEDFAFDVSGILSDEEAQKFFEETEESQEQETPVEEENEPAEETDEIQEDNQEPESVGGEDDENEEDTDAGKGNGSSPTVLSSIAEALKKDGIFPDFEDSELEAVKTPEDFAELVDRAVQSRVDEVTKRVNNAMNNGVQPDVIRNYESTLNYLNNINEDNLKLEGEEGEELRKNLIYNDLINKGYSEDRAKRELEKSFKAGSDIDDARDALDALKAFYQNAYQKIQDDAKKKSEEARAEQKRQSEAFKKMILEDELKLGDSKIDKRTCQKIFDAVSRPVYKDPDTGKLLTEVQKFQKEQPLEFLKQLGMWCVLTDFGKNMNGVAKQQLLKEKNKGIRELEKKINSSNFTGGTLRYDGGTSSESGEDILLSDNWKIG